MCNEAFRTDYYLCKGAGEIILKKEKKVFKVKYQNMTIWFVNHKL